MKLEIENQTLRVELTRTERLLAVRWAPQLDIPLEKIVRVSSERPALDWKEFRIPGSYLPGVIKAGSYYHLGRKTWEFWMAHLACSDGFLVLELKEHKFDRIVMTVPEASRWAERIRQAKEFPLGTKPAGA